MQLLIENIRPRKNKNRSYDREKVRTICKSPVSVKKDKLKGRAPKGKLCFIITFQYQIWFKIYMALVFPLLVTIYLATKIKILDLKNITQKTANFLRRLQENSLQFLFVLCCFLGIQFYFASDENRKYCT
jgi:hypothetical protein